VKLRRILREIHDLWLIAGITLLFFFLLEGILSFAFFIKDRFIDSDESPSDGRVNADTFHHAPWVESYFDEFRKCSEVSWEPYVYWRRPAFHGNHIQIDSSGVRRTVGAVKYSKEGIPFRIFMFGGSTLWGTAARDEGTIPSLLTAELAKRGFNVEITNYGESGYVSTQEVILLVTLLQRGVVPQLVIFYDGVNDTYSAYQEKIAGLPQNERHRVTEFNLSNPSSLRRRLVMDAQDFTGMLSTSRFMIGALKRVGVQWEGKLAPAEHSVLNRRQTISLELLARDVVDVYRGNIQVVIALGAHYHFGHLFYWQPTIFQKEHLTSYEAEKRKEVAQFEEHFLKTYELIPDALDFGENVRFADLSGIFSSKTEPLYADWCHVGEMGNGLIAERMAVDVLESKVLGTN
jgi:lysophospholipase L1-like esterase